MLVALMALVATAGVLGQMRMGYFDFEIGLYLRILFGLQLIDYLLFALLVFVVHAVVNQKHVGYLVALIAYGVIAFPSTVGLEHHLLIYGSGPRWTYSDMRGFGPSLGPWLWFKLYWAAWALLLAVAARLLWARGTERSLRSRLQLARRRFTRATAGVAATAVALILTLGGFIFYNTNVAQSRTVTASERDGAARRVRAALRKVLRASRSPRSRATNLRVEIYPERREAEIRGTYRPREHQCRGDRLHPSDHRPGQVETGAVSFDRPASLACSWTTTSATAFMRWSSRSSPATRCISTSRCISRRMASATTEPMPSSSQNGSHFTNRDWLPAIGYQRNRELDAAGVRRQYGLARRPAVPSLDDAEARRIRVGGDPIAFEAIVGTSGDQVAVAPGALRRTWTEGGRRYFHYVTDVPINNQYGVFSARLRAARRTVDPRGLRAGRRDSDLPSPWACRESGPHGGERTRLARSLHPAVWSLPVQLSQADRESRPWHGCSNGSRDRGIRRRILPPESRQRSARRWISCLQSSPTGSRAGGGACKLRPRTSRERGCSNVSLETYSAMRVVEETLGPEHLRRYLLSMREGLVRHAPARRRHCFGPPTRSPAPARVPSRCTRCASTSARTG